MTKAELSEFKKLLIAMDKKINDLDDKIERLTRLVENSEAKTTQPAASGIVVLGRQKGRSAR